MKITEFRIPLPLTLDEYEKGKLYAVNKTSLLETGGGEGVECLMNKPYEGVDLFDQAKGTSGQYTKKIYYMSDRVPGLLRGIAPHGSLVIHEESWNAYPYIKTVATNPGYMKDKFFIQIDTIHRADRGDSENVHNLSGHDLEHRTVVKIDFVNDGVDSQDYKEEEDPKLFTPGSKVVPPRGPFKDDWMASVTPVITAYKLVRVKFCWHGFQNMVESYLIGMQQRMLTLFNRRVYCWIDEWILMSLDEVRQYEKDVNAKLVEQRDKGSTTGKTAL